jgi:hypothetical protein
MKFEFKKNISEKLIFSKYSEEQIMEFYLHIPIRKGLFKSPLRIDHHNTCSFYRNKQGNLIFKDFATGQHLTCINVVMTLFNCSYWDALKIIANDFKIVEDPNIPLNKGKINKTPIKIENKEISKIQVEVKEFSDYELKWWNDFGITPSILKKFNVYSCKHVFLNDQLFAQSSKSCPIYGYYGGKLKSDNTKFELWKCYFPKRKEYRFIGNYPSKILQGYKQLPKSGKFCIVTKSLKDVMALYAYNIPACAPNSETVIPSKVIIDNLLSRFENVFVIWDNDYTGVSFLNKIKRTYPELICLIIPKRLKAKDFSDLRKLYGHNRTKQFIIDYLTWRKNRETSTQV